MTFVIMETVTNITIMEALLFGSTNITWLDLVSKFMVLLKINTSLTLQDLCCHGYNNNMHLSLWVKM